MLITKPRKIIHVDMDCFYAAIEMRDHPVLANRPVAVGGAAEERGVICTANYVARRYGVRSAMSTAAAYRRCPGLIVLPVDMPKYKAVAQHIRQIFHQFTDKVEPLSLDEAYLDVTDSAHCHGSATWMAQAIRDKIFQAENLTASAGVACNKLLAKIASEWNKPNGLYVVYPDQVNGFIKNLPIAKLYGVGRVTAQKLKDCGIQTCEDLQDFSLEELVHRWGKLGERLYHQCRGIDEREVEPNRIRKSLSVEQTFATDIPNAESCLPLLRDLHQDLLQRLQRYAAAHPIKNQCIKIKFADFKSTTAEMVSNEPNWERYLALFERAYARQAKAVRLLGLGVHFCE
jgi:DNA polymerase-4